MKTCEEFKSKNEEELRKEIDRYSQEAGIRTNPDEKVVETTIDGLFKNKARHGEFYCPCRFVTGDKKKDKKIICPCVFHMGEIELEGHCKCFLFVVQDR